MNSENPYQAPAASLGAPPFALEGDLTQAVRGLVEPRIFIRIMAVLAIIAATFSLVGFLGPLMTDGVSAQVRSTMAVGAVMIFVLYGGGGLILWRLSTPLFALANAPTWENVSFTMQRMVQAWTIGVVGFILSAIGGSAARFVMPMAVVAGLRGGPETTLQMATRLRKVMRIFAILAVVAMLANIVLTAAAPTQSQQVFGATLWLIIGVTAVLQLLVAWLIWRHVPALDVFIAQPSAETLIPFASAHRTLWRVILWLAIGTVLVGIAAAVAIPMILMSSHR